MSSSLPMFVQSMLSSGVKPIPVVAAVVSLISYFRNPVWTPSALNWNLFYCSSAIFWMKEFIWFSICFVLWCVDEIHLKYSSFCLWFFYLCLNSSAVWIVLFLCFCALYIPLLFGWNLQRKFFAALVYTYFLDIYHGFSVHRKVIVLSSILFFPYCPWWHLHSYWMKLIYCWFSIEFNTYLLSSCMPSVLVVVLLIFSCYIYKVQNLAANYFLLRWLDV